MSAKYPIEVVTRTTSNASSRGCPYAWRSGPSLWTSTSALMQDVVLNVDLSQVRCVFNFKPRVCVLLIFIYV